MDVRPIFCFQAGCVLSRSFKSFFGLEMAKAAAILAPVSLLTADCKRRRASRPRFSKPRTAVLEARPSARWPVPESHKPLVPSNPHGRMALRVLCCYRSPKGKPRRKHPPGQSRAGESAYGRSCEGIFHGRCISQSLLVARRGLPVPQHQDIRKILEKFVRCIPIYVCIISLIIENLPTKSTIM